MSKGKRVLIVGGNHGIGEMFRKYNYHVQLNADRSDPDFIVFTGGADVNPQLYGEKPLEETHFSELRDRDDIEAFKKYPAKPKIGICRGAQFLNVMSGGALWQHVDNHTRDHRLINLLPFPDLKMGEEVMVTSTHHQMMIPGDDGVEIAIAQRGTFGGKGLSTQYKSAIQRPAPDHDTEAVWYQASNSLCCQFHPEYRVYPEMTAYFFKLVDHFFN